MSKMPGDPEPASEYCCSKIKPLMLQIRESCDLAETLVKKDHWPYPSYTEILYSHHLEKGASQSVTWASSAGCLSFQ